MGMARRRDPELLEDPHQMLLPLMMEVHFIIPLQQDANVLIVEGMREEQPELVEWTDGELVQLHQYLLEQSMTQALNPRSSRDTRVDVLEWVDRVTPYRKKAAPFSFDACCQISGYDPEELREQLHNEMQFRGIHP